MKTNTVNVPVPVPAKGRPAKGRFVMCNGVLMTHDEWVDYIVSISG